MTVKSPCTDVCELDRRTGWCLGCMRTMDEIARWSSMHDNERRRIVADRPRRDSEAARAARA